MKKSIILFFLYFTFPILLNAQSVPLKVIVFGAHPDDCDLDAGGLAALYSSMGHKVKFVSLTNGDKGHQEKGGGELAKIRFKEAKEAGKRFGVEYVVLDNHDGELMPTLENRNMVIKLIREWNADVVIAPRTNDYHPDHRYTGVLVQDAAYLVIVPNIVPHTPPLEKNPLFLYGADHFQRPNPFRPDIAIDITPVFDQKIHALSAHSSQFFEWLPWTEKHRTDHVPADSLARKKWLSEQLYTRMNMTPDKKESLQKWYGKDKGAKIEKAEFFEICEYGLRPTAEDLKRLLPMLPKN